MIEVLAGIKEYESVVKRLIDYGCKDNRVINDDRFIIDILDCRDIIVNVILYKEDNFFIDIYGFNNNYEEIYKVILDVLDPVKLSIHFIERRPV